MSEDTGHDRIPRPRAPWTEPPDLNPNTGPGGSWQPRIVPTPKPSRRRLVQAALLGLLAGLLVFGTAGFFTGYAAAPDARPAPPPKPTPTASTLPLFERTQLELNEPKFPDELMPIARSWLPWINTCARSGDPGGPHPASGEALRVSCHYANADISFIRYRSTDDRDKAYAYYLGQHVDAKRLTPGVADPATKRTTSGAVQAHYLEYAFRANTKTVCGIWWADATAPIAAYIIVYWSDGLGENWQPLREVWQRYS